jgi:hypothetical protein
LEKFRKRNEIEFKLIHGEAGDVDVQQLLEWQQKDLALDLCRYNADDVFNIDESGLYWKALPNKTMALKG